MFRKRRFRLESAVHALGLGYSLMPVIVHEHILLKDEVIFTDHRIRLDPVERLAFGDEDLAFGGGDENVRLDIAEGFA